MKQLKPKPRKIKATNVKTGECQTFNSILECAKQCKKPYSTVCRCATLKSQTRDGYKFEYLSEPRRKRAETMYQDWFKLKDMTAAMERTAYILKRSMPRSYYRHIGDAEADEIARWAVWSITYFPMKPYMEDKTGDEVMKLMYPQIRALFITKYRRFVKFHVDITGCDFENL